MNDEPLSPELRLLIEAERARPEAPASAQAAAHAQLAALLGPASGLASSASLRDAGVQSSGVGAPAPRGPGIQGASLIPVAKLLAAFAVGGLAGGMLTGVVLRPAPRVVFVDRPVAPALVAAPLPSANASLQADTPQPVTSSVSARAPAIAPLSAPSSSSPPRSHDAALAAERAVIERARSALARGDAPGALSALAQHQRDFPRGQLTEEREALAVQALVAAGRTQEATERAARFRKAFPNSLLLPLVDQALR